MSKRAFGFYLSVFLAGIAANLAVQAWFPLGREHKPFPENPANASGVPTRSVLSLSRGTDSVYWTTPLSVPRIGASASTKQLIDSEDVRVPERLVDRISFKALHFATFEITEEAKHVFALGETEISRLAFGIAGFINKMTIEEAKSAHFVKTESGGYWEFRTPPDALHLQSELLGIVSEILGATRGRKIERIGVPIDEAFRQRFQGSITQSMSLN